jgi:hypothetical protein
MRNRPPPVQMRLLLAGATDHPHLRFETGHASMTRLTLPQPQRHLLAAAEYKECIFGVLFANRAYDVFEECYAGRKCRLMDSHNSRIRAKEAYRDKLVQIKKGLIDDLLTGRMRVPAATEEAT